MILTKLRMAMVLLLGTSIASSAGLLTLRTVASEKEAAQVKVDEKAADKPKKDTEQIQGLWTVVATFDGDGKRLELADNNPGRFSIELKADNLTARKRDDVLQGSYALAPTKSPKEIDVTLRQGDKDRSFKGIYSIENDNLKLCMGAGSHERPKEFKQGTTIEFAVELKRAKP